MIHVIAVDSTYSICDRALMIRSLDDGIRFPSKLGESR